MATQIKFDNDTAYDFALSRIDAPLDLPPTKEDLLIFFSQRGSDNV